MQKGGAIQLMGPDPNGRIDRSLSRSGPAPRYHLRPQPRVCHLLSLSPTPRSPFYAGLERERERERKIRRRRQKKGKVFASRRRLSRGSSLSSLFASNTAECSGIISPFVSTSSYFSAGRAVQDKRGAKRERERKRSWSLFHEQKEQKGLWRGNERKEQFLRSFFRTSLWQKRAREKVTASR